MSKDNTCCNKPKKKAKNWKEGLIYGLVPHIGCIGFIIGSIFGVTVLMQFFKPLLMNKYFFHYLVALSLVFATISSVVYLRKNGQLSFSGAKTRWKYLAGMYGSTIGVNLVLFLLIFPMLANVSIASPITGDAVNEGALSSITLSVDIPCPGHAPLISNELKTIEGVRDIKFSFPNDFEVKYDGSIASKEDMLALGVFFEYPAEVIDESSGLDEEVVESEATFGQKSASCGGSCGGTSSCGGTGSCGGSSGSSGGCGCGGCGGK